jgi:hypothetical protein
MDALTTTPQPEFKWLSKPRKDEDKIFSVLDLINTLKAHGIIEVGETEAGLITFYRILTPLKETSREERQEQVRRINDIFRRRQKTKWSDAELTALRHATIPLDELSLVERYYKAEANNPGSFCRTSILTFLRHFPGEVDRARRWQQIRDTKHCY